MRVDRRPSRPAPARARGGRRRGRARTSRTRAPSRRPAGRATSGRKPSGSRTPTRCALGQDDGRERALDPAPSRRRRPRPRSPDACSGDQRGDRPRCRRSSAVDTRRARSSSRSSAVFVRLPLWPSATVRPPAWRTTGWAFCHDGRAGGRVAGVADRDVPLEPGEPGLVEHLAHEAHVLHGGDVAAVATRRCRPLSWPRCWRAKRPKKVERATSCSGPSAGV